MFPILSGNQIKFIRSLKQKKYRYKFKKYLVEGTKQITDILHHGADIVDYIVISDNEKDLSGFGEVDQFITGDKEFGELSGLVQPQGVMAVCQIPETYFSKPWSENGFALYFDGIQDPGNLGTMLRAAEWNGIVHILIGPETVDPYNPKVIQAAMGSQTFLQIYQCDHQYLSTFSCPILVADMTGQDAYTFLWPENGILIMSNEGLGVSTAIQTYITDRLTLPSASNARTESLNVSMACTALLTLRHLSIANSQFK